MRMPSFWMFLPIAHIAGSFIAGFIFFYLMSALSKAKKKQQAEEVTSLLINFVIYIWIGKILLNFLTFIKDPLAVLAYPSNSHAFYISYWKSTRLNSSHVTILYSVFY